jgi:SAM-dependent methyltransferase
MHPATARALVLGLGGKAGGKTLLDPFCGSGTSLIEARRLGHLARGVDVSPLAVGIARAKTWVLDKERRKEMRRIGKDIAADAVAAGKDARRSGAEVAPIRQVGKSPSARAKELGPWFMPHVRRELEDLAARIDEVGEADPEMASVLRVALSAILYKVSLRASDTDASLVQKNIARGNTSRMFGDRVEMLWDGLNALAHTPGPAVEVILGDARQLAAAGIAAASVDLIVTSSPYAGTYDYVAQQGLRLAFFGIDAKDHEAREIGARGRLARSTAGIEEYRRDLGLVLKEWVRVLKPGAVAALMIGDSLGGREAVFADQLVNDVMPDELEALAWAWQERPKLGSAELKAFGEETKREHILLARRI